MILPAKLLERPEGEVQMSQAAGFFSVVWALTVQLSSACSSLNNELVFQYVNKAMRMKQSCEFCMVLPLWKMAALQETCVSMSVRSG